MAGDRYKDEKFVGWLKVNLSLILAKEGVEKFSDDEVKALFNKLKRNISSSSASSSSAPGPHTCNDKRKLTGEWAKGKFSCQADQCDLWLDEIRKEYLGSPASVVWDNCNRARLSSDAWACAKLFLPNGSASYTCASDADVAALLTLFLKCHHFMNFFSNVDVCKKVKDIRNKMMHTCKMEVDAALVTAYTTQIIEFLEDPKHLLQQPPCQEAVRKIKELLSGKTEISLNKELELRVLNTELHNLVDVVDALGTKAQDTDADVTSNAEDLKTLRTEQQQLKSELVQVKSKSEEFSQFLIDYKIKGVSPEKLSEVSNKIARLETQIQTQMKELTDRIETLEKQCKVLATEQSGQKLKLDQLETGHSAFSQEQGSQRQRLDELETGHSAVSQEQGSQRQRLDELETGHSAVSQEQGSQRQRLDQLETGHSAVSQEQGSQRQRLDQLETTVSQEQGSQRQRLDQLETGHSAVSQEQGSQRQRLDQLETTVSQEQGSQRQRLDQLETGHSAVSQEQGSQRQRLDQLETGHSAVSQEQGSQRQRLDELETDHTHLKSAVEEKLVMREISCKDLQCRLIYLYRKTAQKVPIYPLQPEWRTHVASLFVLPSMKVINPRGISKHHLMRGTDDGSDIKVTSIQDIFPPAGSSCTDIYIMGDAGTGKSTLCEYLVHLWVSCRTSSNQAPDSEEKFMERFEFLFYISLRGATSCKVEDMIQSQLQLKDVNVSRLLYDHSSLIILDGLDEYSLKQTSWTRFGTENVPYRNHSDKCTVLTTSRPWKLELLRKELEPTIDKQITIVGLDTESQKKLVEKVADLLKSEEEHDRNPADFITEVQAQKLDKVMETPILLMQMLGLWFSGQSMARSKCSIYAKLIDKQIQFTEEVRKAAPKMTEVQGNAETTQKDLFSVYFENNTYIMSNKKLLQKVCKFAFYSLTSKDRESSLVFSHEQMELFDMSREEISLCLDIGLLTQYKVFGGITRRLKHLCFVHKSYQEFFAAIYLSQQDQATELKQLLERDFTSLSDILEMGTVFMFVCGMNPSVARNISRFIMDKTSGEARLEQYRQRGYDWSVTDPNTALVLQLQSLILAGIEEGRHNGHKITGMQLQDLYMNVTEQDFPPTRILACMGSLNLTHIKSIYIQDKGAISRDALQQLLKETSKSLHKLVLRNTVVSVEMIQTVVQQNKGRVQTLGLINVNVDSVVVSHLSHDKLQAILSAPTKSLSLRGLVLTHSQLELMCQHVSISSYGEVQLGKLQCTTHGYRGTECKQRLDLSTNMNLSRLVLMRLPVNEVRFVPENLVRCDILGELPEPVATSCISCLQRAEKLEVLSCGDLRGSTVVELCTTMPHLVHLQHIYLIDINLSGQEQVVRAVAQLKKLEVITLLSVTMREEDLRELLAALPSSHRVTVEMGHIRDSFPVTITDYNRHTDLLAHIRHNPDTRVTRDKVEFEGGTCIVKEFRCYKNSGCSWVTAAAASQ